MMVAGGKETAVAPEALFVGAAVRVRAVHLMVLVVSLGARVVTGASEVEARVAEREVEAAVVVKVEEVRVKVVSRENVVVLLAVAAEA